MEGPGQFPLITVPWLMLSPTLGSVAAVVQVLKSAEPSLDFS
jgi:hypothetical protein